MRRSWRAPLHVKSLGSDEYNVLLANQILWSSIVCNSQRSKLSKRRMKIPKGLNVTGGSLPCLDAISRRAPKANTPLSGSTQLTQSIWQRVALSARSKRRWISLAGSVLWVPPPYLLHLFLPTSGWTTYQSWLFWAASSAPSQWLNVCLFQLPCEISCEGKVSLYTFFKLYFIAGTWIKTQKSQFFLALDKASSFWWCNYVIFSHSPPERISAVVICRRECTRWWLNIAFILSHWNPIPQLDVFWPQNRFLTGPAT